MQWLRRLLGLSEVPRNHLRDWQPPWEPPKPRPAPPMPHVEVAPGMRVSRPSLYKVPRGALAPLPGAVTTSYMNDIMDGSVFAVATDFDDDGKIMRKVYVRSDIVRTMTMAAKPE